MSSSAEPAATAFATRKIDVALPPDAALEIVTHTGNEDVFTRIDKVRTYYRGISLGDEVVDEMNR